MIDKSIPPPPKRVHKSRMSDELKQMKPSESALVDAETAHAFKAHGDYHGWETRRQTQPTGKVRVWRIS